MRHGSPRLLALLIVLVLICPLLIGTSFALTATLAPTNSEPVYPPPNIGTIANTAKGTVYDASGNPIPNAKVTLYNAVKVGKDYKAMEPVGTESNNPQMTGDGSNGELGQYKYTNVLSGAYILTAEKNGILVSNVIYVTGGIATNDVFIQGYVENGSGSATPVVTVTEGPTYRPPPPSPTISSPADDIGTILGEIFRIALMAIVGVQFIASIAILAIGVGKR